MWESKESIKTLAWEVWQVLGAIWGIHTSPEQARICNYFHELAEFGQTDKQLFPLKLDAGEPSSAPPAGEHKRQRCGHRTLHSCPSCGLCFSCCDCREFGKELGITFCDDIAEDGEGSTPWEVPAEPEPLYFETLKEAIKGYINMLSKECDKLESGAAQEVSPPSPEPCGEPAASFIPRWGMSFACVLPKGHEGEHKQGGNCFKHGDYVGALCPQWPSCLQSSGGVTR